ncbi:MAG: protein-(glutamine-N5) methyltransferase, release factor-specific [Oceanospirillaceae bacterium]|nr:peptide chain release factor N(5)-glutamine methyltransferase [Thalassolituus sp. UBA1505]MAS26435.1 protein-(glutamine-N5) methyltransferase, release factor-specific [Oceanospirillaceae bacterium]MAX98254.1 protein-(glutamine-N5) methyltransferase, release factor-specific [Oceanospirillaceae bacterium]MBL34326.1 protein-(glutamine-N5) methyltransferase, release factor-specific [Oceanospirillaceae bacterium]MBS54169.1 protein-(glutamine-N5) methyltransferase, release factor-specific [Oceanos
MPIEHWLRSATEQLQASSESARLDSECLLAHVLGQNRTWLYTWSDRGLTAEQLSAANALLQRRIAGEPVAYLCGQRDFWSLTLDVNPSTLIPRGDTETLIEWALELPVLATANVLDLGTGTGAIALALASEQPSWHVQGVDFQAEAVALARTNAAKNNLSRVTFEQSDWFSALAVGAGRFDLIVSNPPYIDGADEHLQQGDVRFEPRSALVAEEQGLADLRHIIEQAPDYLTADGWLLLEHGWQQADAVCELLRQRGFTDVENRCDLGANPRISGGRWPAQRIA